MLLTAFTFQAIFEVTTPLSNYLQSTGLDHLQSWMLVESATTWLTSLSCNFNSIKNKAMQFAKQVNEQILCTGIFEL